MNESYDTVPRPFKGATQNTMSDYLPMKSHHDELNEPSIHSKNVSTQFQNQKRHNSIHDRRSIASMKTEKSHIRVISQEGQRQLIRDMNEKVMSQLNETT